MKPKAKLLALLAAFSLTFLYTGCLEDGKDGLQGPPGAKGDSGKPGLSGDAKCQVCHNDSSQMLAKILQYRNSTHAVGARTDRNGATCARCHTNEGFVQFAKTGIDSVPGGVENPTPQNCRTCHMIHTNYDTTDFRMRMTGPVNIRVAAKTAEFGKAAACASCHQPRGDTRLPVVGGDSVSVTNNRWGPHYGAQAVILSGIGGYEAQGSEEYKNSEHSKRLKNGCADCHMAKPVGLVAGGHTLNMSYGTNASPNLNGCATCHTDGLVRNFNYKNVKDSVKILMDSLKVLLVKKGMMVDSTELARNGKYPADVAGAFWNFKMVYADHSNGNHNFPYTKALLKNSIEALNK